jgi:beta-glucanase (GH16 family)
VTPPYAYETRARPASGRGMWSGLGWQTNEGHCEETDFEQLGRQPTGINQTAVAATCPVRNGTLYTDPHGNPGPALADAFHIYTMYVTADHVDSYVDGAFQGRIAPNSSYCREASPCLTLGVALSAWQAETLNPSTFHLSLDQGDCDPDYPSWAGCPDDYSPRTVRVDWFRVYTP